MVTLKSLLDAWDEFKTGKRPKRDVAEFEYHLEDNLFRLHEDLTSKRYRHGAYHAFYIKDPKTRLIHKATVRDRIIHHLIYQALNPTFEPTFIADSYSSRKTKGTHRAVKQLNVFVERTYRAHRRCFVLKCDIRKFFHSIDHEILTKAIARHVKDQDMLWLVKTVIESFPDSTTQSRERERERVKGCPIGNLTSQLFANIYLNELDQFLKRDLGIQYYIRYTDDFVIVHHEEKALRDLKTRIDHFLHTRLLLELHPDKVSIRKYHQGIDFLGYVTLPRTRVLRTKTKRRILKKIRHGVAQFKQGIITETALVQSINSYLGVLRHANTHRLKQQIEHFIWTSIKTPDDLLSE